VEADLENVYRKPLPPDKLLIARRRIDELKNVQLLEDWKWDKDSRRWYLFCRLTISTEETRYVPKSSNWFIFVPSSYPWGKIEFYPAKKNGLAWTFPHQTYNDMGSENTLWREGKICLETSVNAIIRFGYDTGEPFDIEERLVWYFKRALAWLEAAASNALVAEGDPFEIPHYPVSDSSCFGFAESLRSYTSWEKSDVTFGYLEYIKLHSSPEVYAITNFLKKNRQPILQHEIKWGSLLTQIAERSVKHGIWIILPDIPVLFPWQAPISWEELRKICEEQGVDILEIIRGLSNNLRDNKNHLMILGFPIANKIGGSPNRIYWQALKLPVLSCRKNSKGFSKDFWTRDRMFNFKDTNKIHWIKSENWHRSEIYSRGSFDNAATAHSVLLLGTGAIGSVIGEQLLRAGIKKLTVMDDDLLNVGNLVRHTLDLRNIRKPKSLAFATKGKYNTLHAEVESIIDKFPPRSDNDYKLVEKCDVIIDCTAEDDVLCHLSECLWEKPKTHISISFNLGATKLFIFAAHGKRFPSAVFFDVIRPWLRNDLDKYDDIELPREGIGCWHPVFPARIDDVSLLASVAIKNIEPLLLMPPEKPVFMVFEQKIKEDIFSGIELIHREEHDG